MSPPIIRVEGLGKRYRLRHQDRRKYVTLRDVIAEKTRALGGRLTKRGSANSAADEEEFWALRHVSFDIAQGEVVGIIGRNGAGKSTLLKILSRITEPSEGRVRIRGRVASLLEVGTGFHAELSGRENIFLNGAILGMTRAEIARKFDEIVAFAEVEKFLDTPVKHYSSGMYVRLAFAVAAHLEPEILIVDEVLAVGDAEFQRKCIGKMRDVSSGGRTVIFVSHQMGSVRALCDKGLLLRSGVVEMVGPVGSVISHYMNSFRDGGTSRDAVVKAKCRYLEDVTFLGGAADGVHHSADIGGAVSLRVKFSLPRPSRFPVVGVIARRAESGESVFGSNSRVCGQPELRSPDSKVTMDVSLGQLNLVPGVYLLDIWIGYDNEDLENLDGALELEIVDSNPLGTGKPPLTVFGASFVPMKFEVRGES